MSIRARFLGAGLICAVVASGCGPSWGQWVTAPTDPGLEPTVVSCASPTWCIAGGDNPSPLLQWGGTIWRVAAVRPAIDDVRTVECTTTSFCLAAGFRCIGEQTANIVARFDGTTWTDIAVAADSVAYHDIACASPSACLIVGNDFATSTTTGVALRWNGATLTRTDPPSGNELVAVSCGTPTSCTAVTTTALTSDFHLEPWGPSGWGAPATPPLPSFHINERLDDISCSSATSCVAVGTAYGPSLPPDGGPAYANPVAVHLTNSTWAAQTISGANALSGVSCVSSTVCVIVGFRSLGDMGATFTFDGSAYVQAPSWPGHLTHVECVRDWCMGTGSGRAVAIYSW